MNYQTQKFLVVLLLTFSTFTVYLVIVPKFNLGEIQSLFSIISSLSIGVALLAYFYKKKQDELIATAEQVTFFREEIITKWNSIQKDIKEKYSDFIFSKINLQAPDINFVKMEFSVNFDRQLSIFFDASKKYPDIYLDPILDKQILLLNAIEEFSLKVTRSKTDKNPVFESVYSAFVEIVEQNAVALLFVRDVRVGNPIYSATLSLYKTWQKNTQKTNFVKNLAKYGLIDNRQKEEIYKMRKRTLGI